MSQPPCPPNPLNALPINITFSIFTGSVWSQPFNVLPVL